MRILKTVSAAALFVLSACAGPATPPDSFYRIEPGVPAQRFAKPVLPGVLEISRLASDGVASERAMAFSRSEGGALTHYKYDFWSEPPTLLLQDRLAHWLSAAGAADRVVTPDLRVLGDWVLRGKIRRFELVADKGEALVELDLAVVGARDGRLVLLDTYAARIKVPSDRIEDMAHAMEKGVGDIFTRFTADLGRAAQAAR